MTRQWLRRFRTLAKVPFRLVRPASDFGSPGPGDATERHDRSGPAEPADAFDISRLADGRFERGADGIWRIAQTSGGIAYPEAGNRLIGAVEDGSWWFNHRRRIILEIVRRFPPAGLLWDIGGGNGFVAAGLSRNGIACALLEAGPDGCAAAAERGVPVIVHGRFEDVRFKPGVLEAAGLFDVLEHIEDDGAFLRALRSALAGNGRGRLYVTVPAHPWLWSAEDEWAGHARRYGLPELRGALEAAGFRVLFDTFFFSGLSPFVFLARALPDRFRRRREIAERARADGIRRIHRTKGGLSGRLLERRLAAEAAKLRQGRISHGASLFAVAEAP